MWAVADRSQGLPVYFSLSAGREIGARAGVWIGEPAQALQFARERDAQGFADTYLHAMTHVEAVRVV